jgi:transposase
MKYHPLARTTVYLREQLAKAVVEGRLSLKEASAEFKLSRQSVAKWVKRYRELGVAGLADRSSRPHRLAHQSPAELIERVERMRREGWTGLRIAETTGLSSATVSRMLPGSGSTRRT